MKKKEPIVKENKPLQISNVMENFKLIRYFIFSLGAGFIGMIVCFSYVYLYLHKYHMEHALKVNTNGEVTPMEVVKLKDLYEIEAKDHIRVFIESFFEYDQNNFEQKIEKALWLGDHSVKEIYDRLKNKERWFDKVLGHSLIQRIIWHDLKNQIQIQILDTKKSIFRAATTLEIDSSGNKKFYYLNLKGKLSKVSRHFPLNPHGLLITHFSYQSQEVQEKK